jgi:hypothetical protein
MLKSLCNQPCGVERGLVQDLQRGTGGTPFLVRVAPHEVNGSKKLKRLLHNIFKYLFGLYD